MLNAKTALPVLAAVVVFGIAASQSLFVEGDTSAGAAVPGVHPTTEMALGASDGAPDVLSDVAFAEAPMPLLVPAVPAVKAKLSAPSAPRKSSSRARSSSSSGAPKGYVYWKTVKAKVTAYEPSKVSCGASADGKTSIGQSAWIMDGVATDPRAIPYGTYCMVPGVGGRVVDDTGSAMRSSWRKRGQYHVDVRVRTVSEARRWGVKYLDVKLYKPAK
jgi:3D (Asp-Asp-Asp) domain-containing protein